MGSVANPLVQAYCAKNGIDVTPQSPGPEGYVLRVTRKMVFIAGSDDHGPFYGLQSLRQLAERQGDEVRFQGVEVRDFRHGIPMKRSPSGDARKTLRALQDLLMQVPSLS